MSKHQEIIDNIINFKLNNVTITVRWTALHFEDNPVFLCDFPSPITHFTACEVSVIFKRRERLLKRISVDGHAYCCILDKYDPKTGMKISLDRALEDFPRETRKQVWKRFWKLLKNYQ